MPNPSVSELILKVREIAALEPDRVYTKVMTPGREPACKYVHGDQPGCLFGRALLELGVDIDILRDVDVRGMSIGPLMQEQLTAEGAGTDSDHYPTDLAWCSAVQGYQDALEPWGTAVADANREYPKAGK